MAIPRRTQAVPLARSADRPSYLADLPHVDEKSTSVREPRALANSSAQPAVSTHPAFAEIVTLSRDHHHGADPTSVEKHFLDDAHGAANDQVQLEEDESADEHQLAQMRHSRLRRRGWRGFFSQAHTQLAPFAGLIVTLALLTSAGLLFWLISRGQPPNFDLRNFDINEGPLSVQLSESEPTTSAIPVAETPDATDKVQESANATQAAAPVDQPTEPLAKEPVQASPPNATASIPLGEISFLTTSTPFAFDFSKAFDTATAEPSEEFHCLPEVAELEDSSAESPVAR